MKLIAARWVLPIHTFDPIPHGAIVVDGEKIVAVGTAKELQQKYPLSIVEEFPESILLPGLINAHCHLDRVGFYSRFPVATDQKLAPVPWLLESLTYLSKTSSSTVVGQIQSTLKSFLEQGVTAVGAMTHYEGTYPVFTESPLRGVVFQEILSGPDKRAQQRFEVALALIERYKEEPNRRVKIGFGPYAAYTLSKNLLNIIAYHAKDLKLPMQMHVAEHFAEMEFFYESKGPIATQYFPAIGWEELPACHRQTPIEFLDAIGFFTAPLSIIGAYQMRETDFPKLARGLAKVIYCPSGNQRFGLGQFPLQKLQQLGIPIALGTELFSDAEGFDFWKEMQIALQDGIKPLPTGYEVLKMATLGGAFALEMADQVGSLQTGKQADYLVIKTPDLETASPEDLYRTLIQQTTPSSIQQVVIGGAKV